MLLEAISKHLKKKGTESSQDGTVKRKSYLANSAAFYDSVICSVDKMRWADIIFLNFSYAFDTVSDHILTDKLK